MLESYLVITFIIFILLAVFSIVSCIKKSTKLIFGDIAKCAFFAALWPMMFCLLMVLGLILIID